MPDVPYWAVDEGDTAVQDAPPAAAPEDFAKLAGAQQDIANQAMSMFQTGETAARATPDALPDPGSLMGNLNKPFQIPPMPSDPAGEAMMGAGIQPQPGPTVGESASGAMGFTGNLVRGAGADLMSKMTGDPNYGGNIKATLADQPLPVDAFIADAAKTNPNLATAANFGQDFAAAAPLFAAGGLPGWASKLVAAGFTADMISKAPQLFKEYAEEKNKPESEQDPGKLAKLKAGVFATFTFAPLTGAHAIGEIPGQVSSAFDTANRMLPRPPIERTPNAPQTRTQQESNLVEHPGVSSGGTPAETGGGDSTVAKPGESVAGNQDAQQPAAGDQLPLIGQAAVQRIVDLSPEDYQKEVKSAGDITGQIAYPLAEKITAADFPAMEAAAKEIKKQGLDAMRSAKTPEEMGAAFKNAKSPQIFTEAIRMRQAIDDALATGAKTKEEFAALEDKHGVGKADKGQVLMDTVKRVSEKPAEPLKMAPSGPPEYPAVVELANGKRIEGKTHEGIIQNLTPEQLNGAKRGFLAPDGKFMSFTEVARDIEAKQKAGEKAPPAPMEEIRRRTAAKLAKLRSESTRPFFDRASEAEGLGRPSTKPTVEDVRAQRAADNPQVETAALDPQSGSPVEPPKPPVAAVTPTPESAKTPTSIKNAQVDIERQKRGLPPAIEPARRSFGKVWDDAMAIVERDPQAQTDLINELRDKPRALTDTEDALLLHRQIDLQNNYDIASASMTKAHESGQPELTQEENLRLARISDQLLDIYNIGKKAGTETGRGLNARKMLANEDYSLAAMETKMRVSKGGAPLTEAERGQIAGQQKKIEATQKAVDEHAATAEKKEISKSTDATMKDVAREAPGEARSKDFDLDREEKLSAAIKAKVDKGQLNEITSLVQQLARVLWRRGVRGREPMIDGLHDILKTIVSGITREQTQRAFSGYGDFTPLSKESIDVGLRDLRGQTQQVLKLEALEARKPLEKTGQERRTPSDEERRLIKQVNELKRKYGVVVTDPATQLRSALQSRKTYYEHRISDLKHEIETREKIVKTKSPSPTDPELEKMKLEYEALKKEHGEIFTKPGLTDAQRLDMAAKSADRQIAELERQLKTGEIFPKGKNEFSLTSAELEAKRARIEALKEERDWARDLVQPSPEVAARKESSLSRSLDTQIKNLEAQINRGEIFPKGKKPTEIESEAIQKRKAELARLKERRANLRETIQPSPEIDPNAAGLKALKTRLKNRTAELLEKTAAGDFSAKPKRSVQLDSEAQRLKSANENAKLEFDRAAMRQRLKQRTPLEKAQDTFTKWRRGFLLSSPVTLAKLTSAALQRMAFTPTEEAVGGAYSKLPVISRVARQAPREGGMNTAAEAKAITEGFTKGMKDAQTTLKTGHSDLDSLFGRRDVMPREVIDMIGSIHGALKAPVKRAEFARSFEKRTAFAIKNGLDASDPMVQTKIAIEAYKDANRSIFMQDNAVVSAFSRAMSALEQPDKATGKVPPGRKAVATAAKFALPIVKVPTNIIAETITHATGLPTGLVRIVNDMRKGGLDNLPPERADLIMRELKKGSLGAAFLLAGFFAPQMFGGYYQPNDKKQTGHPKFGTMQIFGVNVPTFLIHSPLLETLQIGATIRHVADSKLHKKDADTQGVGAGVLSAALGLTEEVPFVRNTTDMLRMMNPYERQKYFNQVAKDVVVPLGVSWVAAHFDKDAQGNYIPRDPKTVIQAIESGIPGLRGKVPIKGQSDIPYWAK